MCTAFLLFNGLLYHLNSLAEYVFVKHKKERDARGVQSRLAVAGTFPLDSEAPSFATLRFLPISATETSSKANVPGQAATVEMQFIEKLAKSDAKATRGLAIARIAAIVHIPGFCVVVHHGNCLSERF